MNAGRSTHAIDHPTEAKTAWSVYQKSMSVRTFWIAVLLLTGVLFWIGRWIPAMQSPDEGTHLIYAYSISKGRLFHVTPKDQSSGLHVDANMLKYGLASTFEWLSGSKRLTEQRQAELNAIEWEPQGKEVFFSSPGTAYYAPLIYAPHALGLALGRWFGLTVADSVACASFLASALTSALVVAAFTIWRPPWIVLGLLALPMTLAQAASPTIDGIATGALLLCLSLFVRHWSDVRPLSPSWLMLFLVSVLACGTSRIHLLVLLILPLVLAVRLRQTVLLIGGMVCATLVLGWTAHALLTTVDLRATRSLSTLATVHHYALAPQELLALLGRTLISPQRLEFYGDSFIGILGWLDVPLSAGQYRGFSVGLALLLLVSVVQFRATEWQVRVMLLVLALISTTVIFLALALTFTDVNAQTIEGIQGRYFLSSALMVAYGLCWGAVAQEELENTRRMVWGQRLGAVLAMSFAAASVWVLSDVLDARYRLLDSGDQMTREAR